MNVLACPDNFPCQFNMGMTKATAIPSAFIQYTNQINDGITTGKMLFQLVHIMDISLNEFNCGQQDQIIFMAFTVTRKNAQFYTFLGQAIGKSPAYKASASNNTYFINQHGINSVRLPVPRNSGWQPGWQMME